MSRMWANEPMRALTLKELADAAYPSATNQLSVSKGYHYSNTNYVLAAMIAEKASGKSFTNLVHEWVIEPFGSHLDVLRGQHLPGAGHQAPFARLLRE
jgi:D-alanyl-D-alanine carboxypeptidase